MTLCKYSGCKKEEVSKGYCGSHYNIYNKGDKKIGVYVMYFDSIDGRYYYVGKAFLQPISVEVSKHKSSIRKQEKRRGKKLQECFKKIRLEHKDLDIQEVIKKYIDWDILVEYDAMPSILVKDKDSEEWYIDDNKDTKKEGFVKVYTNFLTDFIGIEGLKKNADLSKLTKDEKEILTRYLWKWKMIDKQETQKINEFKERYGEFCLNSRKVKK